MSFGEIIKQSGKVTNDIERSPVEKGTGLTQENREELRAEFLSTGGIVTSLPDVSEVRDFTIVSIMSKNADLKDVANLYIMIMGKWFNLNEYTEKSTGAYGGADQYHAATVLTFTGVDDITQLTTNWVAEQLSHMTFANGIFTIEKSGHYKICWSMSYGSAGNNKIYEAGVCLNFIQGQKGDDQIQQGWASRKMGAGTDIGDMSSYTLLELRAGDKISIGMVNETDTTGATLDHMSFTIFRIR